VAKKIRIIWLATFLDALVFCEKTAGLAQQFLPMKPETLCNINITITARDAPLHQRTAKPARRNSCPTNHQLVQASAPNGAPTDRLAKEEILGLQLVAFPQIYFIEAMKKIL
jgi:hypothetical protein